MPEPHAAFKNCGQKAGVEIWRIENFQPVAVPTSHYGKFYTGDSYIVLKTTGTSHSFSYHIHFWLGGQSTQDEKGAAAILSVNLDEAKFYGAAVQHREIQGHETDLFLGYFQPNIAREFTVRVGTDGGLLEGFLINPKHVGLYLTHKLIRYMDGGHASGFSHVSTNDGAKKRFFQIKGKRNVRVWQIEPHVSKMNKGDCFILDEGHTIFVYVGEEAKNTERIKAIHAANQIRDQDHNGRGNVEIIDVYSSDADVDTFFATLGSGDKDSVPPASSGGDDEAFESGGTKEAKLFEISDESGSMKITEMKPITGRDQLSTNECYILDASTSGVYVWVGKKSNTKEKSEAMNRAEEYLKSRNGPDWVHVSKVPEGGEPAAFKMFFPEWA